MPARPPKAGRCGHRHAALAARCPSHHIDGCDSLAGGCRVPWLTPAFRERIDRMRTYLTNIWDWLRMSLWLGPTILAIAAVALGNLLPYVDQVFATDHWPLVGTTAATARSTLSAIVGATMAVTGTVFSITVVTLSLTSQQFGPRLLRTFMHDFSTQLAMGTFLATGLYCLLVLRVVEVSDGAASIPHMSVLVAVLLTVFSMAVLIYFIHHISVLIQAPHVVAAVARDLDDAIVRLFPEEIGHAATKSEEPSATGRVQAGQLGDDFQVVDARVGGYVQAVDADGLLSWASDHDLVIQLLKRPGHFACRNTPIARIWSRDSDGLQDCTSRLNDSFIVGIRRTPRQDVECAIEELVEVAVRSLSPGINDPFTAINCIDWLKSSMLRLARRRIPLAHRCDAEGTLRLIAEPVTFADAMDAAFNQIRQYGKDSPAVMIRLLESFADLAANADRQEDRQAIREHAHIVMRAAEETFAARYDREAARHRHQEVERALGDQEAEGDSSAVNSSVQPYGSRDNL